MRQKPAPCVPDLRTLPMEDRDPARIPSPGAALRSGRVTPEHTPRSARRKATAKKRLRTVALALAGAVLCVQTAAAVTYNLVPLSIGSRNFVLGDPLTSRLTLTAATPSLNVPGDSSYEYRDAVAYELDLVFENVSTTIRGTGDVLLRNGSSSTDMLIKLKEVRFGEFFFEPVDFFDGYTELSANSRSTPFPDLSIKNLAEFLATPDPLSEYSRSLFFVLGSRVRGDIWFGSVEHFYVPQAVSVTPVPLPASALALGAGLAGLFAVTAVRRQRARPG